MSTPQTLTSKRGLCLSLRLRLLLAFTLVFTLFFAAASAWVYTSMGQQAMQVQTADLVSTLAGAAAGVDAAELDALLAAGPLPVRADGQPDDARYWRQVQWLAAVRQIEPRARLYLYRVTAPSRELVVFVSTPPLNPPADGRFPDKYQAVIPATAANQQGLITTTVQTGPGAAGACAYATQACLARPYPDQWGQWLSAYTPIQDAQGQTVAALGMDFDARLVLAARQRLLQQAGVIGLSGYAVMLALIYLTSVLTARPAQRLVQAVQHLGQGRAPEALAAGGLFQDEISTLAEVIQQSRRLEAALRESEARYRRLFQDAALGLFQSTPEGGVIAVNPAFARMFGYASPEEVQAQVKNVSTDIFADPGRRQEIIELQRAHPEQSQFENVYRRKDGQVFTGSLHVWPVKDAAGRLLSLEGFIEDISARKQAEAALRESEARYRLMTDNMVDVIWTMTPAGRFTYVSPSVERQRGYTPEEVMAVPVAQAAASPEGAAALEASMAQRVAALEAGDESARVQVHEVEQACKAGPPVMTEVVSRLITDAPGRVVQILGVTRDISERVQIQHAWRQADAALRESEERFRRIFEMSPLGAAVVELDFRFSRVNAALCRILGYTAEELQQLTFPQVTHPDDVAENRAEVLRLLGGESEQYTTEKRYVRKDGSVVWGQVWVRLVRNTAGEPLHLLPLIYDLTARRQAEAAQRAAERRYQEIFDGAVEGIFQSLPGGRFLSVNSAMARIFGYASPEEMIAQVDGDIAHRVHANPQTRADFVRWLEVEGEVREFEAQNRRQDGRLIWTRTNARRVRDESGATLYYEGFLEEITDRKAAEEEIRRLNADLEQRVAARTADLQQANVALTAALRVKTEFLSMMSHELRTPLASILGLAQVLAAQVYGPLNRKQLTTLDELQECGRQFLELISDVLDFASAGEGGLPLDTQRVELGPMVQAAVRAVTPSATRKQLRVLMDRDATVTTMWADPHRLRQMLIHLLNNAVKFTPPGGALGLQVGLTDYTVRSEVRFTVWDTGIGVAPADQERIFEPFVQLDSRLARAYTGSGLGLAVVRRLAEMHGGRVTVESDGVPGRGSRFSLYLPWSDSQPGGR